MNIFTKLIQNYQLRQSLKRQEENLRNYGYRYAEKLGREINADPDEMAASARGEGQ
jgi:hypothetical protein